MPKKITVELYEPHEMAQIRVGREVVHLGNYWDFHAGCHGPIKHIGGKRVDFSKEWTEDIRRPVPVAHMIAAKIGGEVVVKHRKTPIGC